MLARCLLFVLGRAVAGEGTEQEKKWGSRTENKVGFRKPTDKF